MNRIKELREKRSLSQRQFVTDFNKYISTNEEQYKNKRGVKEITFGTASRWENSLNKPTEYMWQALANFFNVTVPYLKGIDDKTVIKKFSSEDLLQELLDRKVLEPVKDKPINLDDVFLLHK